MGFGIFTTVNPEKTQRVNEIVDNIKKSRLPMQGVNIDFQDNKLEFYFSAGFENKTYYPLCYLIQEIAFHYGLIEDTNFKIVYNEEFLVFVTEDIQTKTLISEKEIYAVKEWLEKYSTVSNDLDFIEKEYVKPVSKLQFSFFSKKRTYQKIALQLFKENK